MAEIAHINPARWHISQTAEAFRLRAISPSELLEWHLNRISKVDPQINAFITLSEAAAKAAATASTERFKTGQALSVLDGIPIAIKDNINVAGTLMTNGSSAFWTVEKDADVVRCLYDAGAVILGKLNMDEGALGAATNNPHHGATHNPWRHGYTAGGSSGGAAAAVSAGLVMAAIGTDTLGSVRIPGAFTGVVGFKPTYDLLNMTGVMPLCPKLDHLGLLCKSVADAETIMSVLHHTTMTKNKLVGAPATRIGVLDPLPSGLCDTAVTRAFVRDLNFESIAHMDPVCVNVQGIDFTTLRRYALIHIEVEAARALGSASSLSTYSPEFRKMLDYGRNASPNLIVAAENAMIETGGIIRGILADLDVLILPSTPQFAFDFNVASPQNQGDLTGLANMAGCPAVVIPTGLNLDGLPTSLHLMASPGRDSDLLRIARTIAEAWQPIFPAI